MATGREIQRRMRSVRNIRQITKAMELIAVTRLRRAQQRVLASRPYSSKMRELIGEIATQARANAGDEVVLHPLLERRAVTRVGVVLMTSDRGLCGALNGNTLRAALQYSYRQQNGGKPVEFVVVGRKGMLGLRHTDFPLKSEFTAIGDYPSMVKTNPIARVAIQAFLDGEIDEAVIVFPKFVSTLKQEPTITPLLPIDPPVASPKVSVSRDVSAPRTADLIYEPDPRTLLSQLLPRFVEVQVYQSILETIASEFSARMVAMRNATDNATELIKELQLGYNKARQATITREIIEVSSGAAAQGR